MKAAKPLHVVGLGIVCPVGASAPVATAAMRARLTRIRLSPEDGDDLVDGQPPLVGATPAHVARVGEGAPVTAADDVARSTAQLTQAVRECLAALPGTRGPLPDGILAWLAVREAPSQADPLAQVLQAAVTARAKLVGVRRIVAGQAGGLLALEHAATALGAGEAELALVAGVDALTSDETLKRLAREARLLFLGRSFGFVPGEGAACVLLATEAALARLKLRSLGRVLATGIAKEKNLRTGPAPVIGEGLTQAVRGALDGLPGGGRVAEVYCDLNGERYRTDEWGFTLPRVLDQVAHPQRFVVASTSVGDVGAASGPLLLAMAAADGLRGRTAGGPALIWTSADSGERSAALLELPPPEARLARRTAPPAPPFDAVDRSALAEMFEDAKFLYDLRLALIGNLARDPLLGWPRAGEIEERIEAMIDGLLAAGAEGPPFAEAAWADGSPSALFVGVRVLAGFEQWEPLLARLAATSFKAPAPRAAVVLALGQSLCDRPDAEAMLAKLFAADRKLAALVCETAAALGLAPPAGATAAMPELARQPTVGVFSATFGTLAARAEARWIAHWLPQALPPAREEMAIAWLKADGAGARKALAGQLAQPWALSALALAGEATVGPALKALSGAPAGAGLTGSGWLTLGWWGDPAHVPTLIARLDGDPQPDAVAQALELITGAGLIEEATVERRVADDELTETERNATGTAPAIEREPVRRLSQNRAAWSAWWQANGGRFPPGSSHRAGRPAGVEATLAALRLQTLPPVVRRRLADELTVRFAVRTAFDPGQPVRLQERWLARAAMTTRPPAPAGARPPVKS